MNKEFVPYQESLELKQLGFNKPCFATIDQTEFVHIKGTEYPMRGTMFYFTIEAPTYSQAFRFFRENYRLPSWIEEFNGARISYHFVINSENEYKYHTLDDNLEYKSQEEAELACLKKLIKIVKNEK